METIKIQVEVNVNLSENTKNFIKSLFNGTTTTIASTTQAKPSISAMTSAESIGAPAKSAASSAEPVSKSIEDVRKILAQKVNEHRDAIKQKLTELGAPSVTKLDPGKYEDMYNFLEAL